MTEIKFSPFETVLDPEFALGQLRKATSGADDGELFLERRIVGKLLPEHLATWRSSKTLIHQSIWTF